MERREFLGSAGAVVGAGMVLAPGAFAANETEAERVQVPASERVNVALIGAGQRGTTVMREFMGNAEVEIVGVCDVDQSNRKRGQAAVEATGRPKPTGYSDFRKLLERKDLDAVIVGTPDHWHALPTVLACEAGKDVYVEKPLCHNMAEGRAMIAAAERNNRITQMGTQIHNHPSRNYARVAHAVESGMLGDICKVRCWKSDPKQNYGNPADSAPPEGFDYDKWLGPAPKREYNPNRSHFKWRYFWDYAGGKFGDFGCHIMDIPFWALGLGPAKSAVATGGKFVTPDNTETPDSLEVIFEYDDFPMVWSQTVGNSLGFFGMGGIGCIFQGTDATLVTNYTSHKIFEEGGKGEEIPSPEVELPPFVDHYKEFLNSVKSREQPSCNIAYGNKMTTNIHLGNIAYRTGERVGWDADKGIVGSAAAKALESREYRAPWSLDV